MGAIERNRQVRIGRTVVQGQLTNYELMIPSLPQKGKVIRTFQEMEWHTPYVNMTYTDRKTGKTKTSSYPVSEMNYALSKQNLKRCKRGSRCETEPMSMKEDLVIFKMEAATLFPNVLHVLQVILLSLKNSKHLLSSKTDANYESTTVKWRR